MNENVYRIFKTILLTIALFFAFLFVLNSRYEILGNGYIIFDKWTKTAITTKDIIKK